ncbi:MAG: helix-turn-helix transcriptional regulator [Streptosporangiaceae bacterium]|jgi:transcriptional regulator with XRE-family HTH domain
MTRKIPAEQCAAIGANIRALRQRNGWTQARLGQLMGWDASTVCAAEGHRNGRQRRFTTTDLIRLAAIFGTPPSQLMIRCATCGNHPPAGFACLTCGAIPSTGRPAAPALLQPGQHHHAAARR